MARASSAAEALSEEVRAVFAKTQSAIVRIQALDNHGRLAGTGFFIDPNGTLYTSYSIGGQSREITVEHGETKYPATRLLGDSRSGIAILKVESQTPFLALGNSSALSVASPVMMAGYGMDLPLEPTLGVVGGFAIKHMGRCFATKHIRANLPVQRGQGGAPMLNMEGQVVGILISSVEDRAGCFALPIEAAEKVRSDYLRFGEVRPGWIGVGFEPASADSQRVIINELSPDSPAERSGLQKGDQLLEIGNHAVNSREDILDAIFYLSAGDDTSLKVQRAGETLTFTVKAGEHPCLARGAAKPQPDVPLRLAH